VLQGVKYYNNTDWFNNCQAQTTQTAIRFSTAIAPGSFFNVWVCNPPGVLGWSSYMPWDTIASSPWHGVFIHYLSLPATAADPSYVPLRYYDEGDTLSHELGHFLGLLHTFGDNIDGCVNGDNIADTPPEMTAATGQECLQTPPRKTCPGTPGVDPVRNFLDYSQDICLEEYSPMQVGAGSALKADANQTGRPRKCEPCSGP
jgi:hypothetical protein